MDLDIDGLIHLRVKTPFNPITGSLNINLFRNKIDHLREVCKKVRIDILCTDKPNMMTLFLIVSFKLTDITSLF